MLQNYLSSAAQSAPDSLAVRSQERSLSYKQLDEGSSALARQLLQLVSTPCEHIGIYTHKSIETLVAIFSILKSGGVYVPLDPEAPVERTAYIIGDCRLKILITDKQKINTIIENHALFPDNLILINISASAKPPLNFPATWRFLSITDQPQSETEIRFPVGDQDQPAYILYTSGSTGKPKGVVLSHRNAAVYVDWAVNYLKLSSTDVFSSHAPFHFDLSIFDIYACIKCAATLILIPAGISYFADALADFIKENNITVWYSVPSALIRLLGEPTGLKDKLKSIRTLIYAGEVFPFKYLNQLVHCLSDCKVFNFYGPTETNVITYYQVTTSIAKELVTDVPIGESCPYATIKIVDDNLQEVPDGEKGELIVSSSSLMSGYWNDAPKSNLVMKELEFNKTRNIYYLTGDIVYKAPAEYIHFCGRKDNMVKTRGFRVELGEIETVLSKLQSVKQIAVFAVPDPEAGNRIYACLQPADEPDAKISAEEFHNHCRRYLPAYMVPEKIFILPALPLTSTGKINTQELKTRFQAGEL